MTDAKYLLLDTSSELCSAALVEGADVNIRESNQPLSHAKQALVMVDSLLAEASYSLQELDCIGLTHGPGSFTGLRIGLSIAQGLAYGAGIPLVGVTSLATMARQEITDSGITIPALDARMGEVYWAAYQLRENRLYEITPPSIGSPDQFNNYVTEIIQQNRAVNISGCGDGWAIKGIDKHAEISTVNLGQRPSVKGLVDLFLQQRYSKLNLVEYFSSLAISFRYADDPSKLEPVYLRNDVSWEKRKRIRS